MQVLYADKYLVVMSEDREIITIPFDEIESWPTAME
jgi:hypothetical protein